MNELTVTWADGTEPVLIGVGTFTNRWGIDEGQIIPAIRSTAGYAATITRTSDTTWATEDRIFTLSPR